MEMSKVFDARSIVQKVLLHTHGHFLAKMALQWEGRNHKIRIFSVGQNDRDFSDTGFGTPKLSQKTPQCQFLS